MAPMAHTRVERVTASEAGRPAIWMVTLAGAERDRRPSAPSAPSPAFAAFSAAVRGGLRDEHLVLVRIGDAEDLTDAQLEDVHIRTGRSLGRLMWQNTARDEIVRVTDHRPADPEHARGFLSNTAMKLHTDGWDAAGLLCLRPAACGGESLFVSSRAVHDGIAGLRPDLMALFYRPWTWDIRVLTGDPGRPPLRSSIFSRHRGALSCRYGSYLLRNGGADIHPELDARRSEALDLFEALSARDELQLCVPLGRGDAVWMNNRRILHGRRAFTDSAGAPARSLSRLWVRMTPPPLTDPGFLAFDSACFGQPA